MNKLKGLNKYLKNLVNAMFIFDQRSIFHAGGEAQYVGGITFFENKRVKDVDPNVINTYPRLTLYLNEPDTTYKHRIIFDSSDFYYVNNTFGESVKRLKIGGKLIFEGSIYEITDVTVDILDIFDDYSTKFKDKTNHSREYIGEDVPYNIQVFVYINFKDYALS